MTADSMNGEQRGVQDDDAPPSTSPSPPPLHDEQRPNENQQDAALNDENNAESQPAAAVDDNEDLRRRREEELFEQLMLEQEVADQQQQYQQQRQLQDVEDAAAAAAVAAAVAEQRPAEMEPLIPGAAAHANMPGAVRKHLFSYTQTSFLAAFILLIHALRTREQWYLALVYLSSSKWAYVILGNALIALCVSVFRTFTQVFLNGLRLVEAEGLQDFFRWEVTETCLALTMFRLELHVSTGVLFLLLVLMKCLHYVAEQRESHLRMTQDAILIIEQPGFWKNWPRIPSAHARLGVMVVVLQCLDIWAVVECGQTIATYGPSVALFFGFEAAILLVSAISMLLLWQLHVLDGFLHYLHDNFSHSLCKRWLHPWKEIRATLVFAVEVQAQAAKFLFYVTFFAIVFTYYGLPINLFREVYLSFMVLKQRLVAFGKYRQLMASMDRFANPTPEDLVAAETCIICRDSMLMADGKKLPCCHVFHKSCLREWLVQNQICPICRSDITVLEARRRHQQRQEQQIQAEQPQEQAAEEQQPEEATPQPEATAAAVAATTQARDQVTPPVTEGRAPSTEDEARSIDQAKNETGRDVVSPAGAAQNAAPSQSSVFPAFYKVVSGDGALVWAADDGSSVVRTVACGVLVLCQGLQWRSVTDPRDGELVSCMMLRIPDGWVREDHVHRLLHVQLPKVEVSAAVVDAPHLTVDTRG